MTTVIISMVFHKVQFCSYFFLGNQVLDNIFNLIPSIFHSDEEIGGDDGMAVFVKAEEFKKLNVGFELDEGGPSPRPNAVHAFNGERTLRRK